MQSCPNLFPFQPQMLGFGFQFGSALDNLTHVAHYPDATWPRPRKRASWFCSLPARRASRRARRRATQRALPNPCRWSTGPAEFYPTMRVDRGWWR